jgi:hypothetical protein
MDKIFLKSEENEEINKKQNEQRDFKLGNTFNFKIKRVYDLKKTNFSLNTKAKVIFNEENETEAFYAKSNKIIQIHLIFVNVKFSTVVNNKLLYKRV